MNKITSWLELNKDNSKKYKIKVIYVSKIYIKKSEDQLPDFYYLIL